MIAILLALLGVVGGQNSSVSFACNGSTAAYTINFPYLSYQDIAVTSTTAGGIVTTLFYTADFTVNLTSLGSGNTATLTLSNPATKCPVGSTLKIFNDLAITQPYSYKNQTTFDQTLHEKGYDRDVMISQKIARGFPTTSSVYTYTAPGAGSVTRSLDSKLGDMISVKDKGGDPSASAAVNEAAVNAAVALAGSITAVLFPCPGSYLTQTHGTINCNGSGGGGGLPTGAAGGDLGGSYPNPTVVSVADVTNGVLTATCGGNGTAGSTIWQKPFASDARDDEFENVTPYSGWTVIGTQSGTAIDAYASFNAAATYRTSWNSLRNGWWMMQPGYDGGLCGLKKAITVNTNDFVYARISTNHVLGASMVDANSSARIALTSDAAGTHFVIIEVNSQSTPATGPRVTLANDLVADVTVALTANNSLSSIEYIGLHKVGTRFYGWVAGHDGAWNLVGSSVNANTMGWVWLYGTNSGAPAANNGNPIVGFDFIRFKNTATDLP